MKKKIITLWVLLFLASLLGACGQATPALPSAIPGDADPELPLSIAAPALTPSAIPASPTAAFTATRPPPTATQTSTPTPSHTPTAEPTASPTASATTIPPTALATDRPGAVLPGGAGSGVFVYLIALNTGGKVGCGDSAVPVPVPVQRSKDTAADIEAALDVLFSMKSKYYGNLYNPVSYSTLRVQDVEYTDDGSLTVWLSGKYHPTGNDCDNTRVKAQIWSTAKQFGGIAGTAFYINGPHPFGDFVSNDK